MLVDFHSMREHLHVHSLVFVFFSTAQFIISLYFLLPVMPVTPPPEASSVFPSIQIL